jgi:hypothetical protein
MFRTTTLAALALTVAGAGLASAADLPSKKEAPTLAAPSSPFFVNVNSISYSRIFGATDPGVSNSGKFGKDVYTFTHFDVWGYGTNFFNVDLLKSPSVDPAASSTAGATEIYGLFRSTFGLNQLFGTKAFTTGILNNVSLEVGADMNTENNKLGPAKKSMVAGLQFSFALPYKGYFNISPLVYKEYNHNYFTTLSGNTSGDTEFNATWALETVYSMPLGFLPPSVPLTFSGRAAFYGPKGKSWSGDTQNTSTEFNSEQRLTLDVGKMVMGKADIFSTYIGYRYWQNKFGLNSSSNTNCTGTSSGTCTENTISLGATLAF